MAPNLSPSAQRRIAERIRGSENAAVALSMVTEFVNKQSPPLVREGYVFGAARSLDVEIVKREDMEANTAVMTDQQAQAFEKEMIGFGRYEELSYAEIPIDYLVWLDAKARKLAMYLRSRRGQRRIDRQAEPE